MEKDAILSTFQEITDTEDTGFAIEILERLNWDLEMAANHVFTYGHTLPEATPSISNSAIANTHRVTNDGNLVTTSSTRPCDIPDIALSNHSQHPVSQRMQSSNSPNGSPLSSGYVASPRSFSNGISETAGGGISYLSSAHRNKQKRTNSRSNENSPVGSPNLGSSSNRKSPDEITVEIEHDDVNMGFVVKKSFRFRKNSVVLEVKNRAASAFMISVSHQKWIGWPSGAEDHATLASLGVQSLSLKLSKASDHLNNLNAGTSTLQPNRATASIDSSTMPSTDFFNPDLEEMDVDEQSQVILGSGSRLLEDGSADSQETQEKFLLRFRERYGENHPIFFLGSFKEAVENSCMQAAKDRKLLAIYAHHDRSVFANVFCETVLSSEHIVNILNSNFVVWAWDCTLDSNKKTFFNLLQQQFGPSTNDLSLRNHKQYPLMIFVSRQNGIFDIMQIISGSQTLDEVAATMMNSYDQFASNMSREVKQEREREQQQQLLSEQNAAYMESLAADRAKEEHRKREERQKMDEEERLRKRAEEKARKKEETINKFNQQVLPEPDDSFKGDVTNVRIRTPSNETLTRKFTADSELLQLFAYVASLGYFPENYRIMTSWPRQELAWNEKDKSFRDKQLMPTATLLIEKKLTK